jgi:hypothetical protein
MAEATGSAVSRARIRCSWLGPSAGMWQDNEDGGGKVCRQVLEEADERFDASRRGADHYDVSLLFH